MPIADAEAALVAMIGHRLAHLLDDAVGEARQLSDALVAVDLAEHHEFVAADAGDEIAARGGSTSGRGPHAPAWRRRRRGRACR